MILDRSQQVPLRILVVDDETNVRKTLAISLETDGHDVVAVSNAPDAVAEAARGAFDLAFVDLRLGATLGSDLIPKLLAQSPWMQVVISTAHGSIDSAVEVMKRGAADYLTKPFTPAQVKLVVQRAAQLRALEQRVAGLQGALNSGGPEANLQTENPVMKRVIELARQVAISDTTVLIRGESGTGRGVLAKSIHLWSNRAANPFATVSCPALSPQLLESELFGHVKGAFTGAVRDNPGRLAACDGGTMLLDEIGDLPMALQPNLLRSVLDREYERVGEAKTRRADVRILAATNVDLEEAVRAGRFREDLLYRIKVVQIDLPALRDRPEDIASLAERFVAELRNGKPVVGFTNDALAVSLIRVFWMRQRISRSRRYFCSCRRRPEQTSIFNSWPRWGARSKVGNCDAHSNRRTRPKKRWPLFRTSRRRPAEARLWRRDQNEGAGGYHCIKSAHAMRHPTQFRSLQWALKASFVHL